MTDFNWTQFFIVGIIALIIGGVLGVMIFPKEIEKDCPELNETDCPELNETDCPECEVCKTSEEIEKEAIITGGYLIDGFFLEEPISKTLDNELILFYGKVEFDGDDYDAEEIFTLTDLTLKANEYDFEGNAYLTFPKKGLISYEFSFLETLNISAINDEETLILDLLGEEVEISKWGDDKITFTRGEEYFLIEGESIVVDGNNVTLELVLQDVAYVSVNGEGERIIEGRIRTIEGLEIKVKEVLYDTRIDRDSKSTLIIGKDIETTVSDGEEYGEDEIWIWVIDDDEFSIGITLANEYTDLDEEYNALAPEDKICLPNDYVCVRYNGLIGEDTEKYTFELDSDGLYIEVEGDFLMDTDNGRTRYDKIYIGQNENEIYKIYKDRDLKVLISEESIELEDMGLTLNIGTETESNWIKIEDFRIDYEFDGGKISLINLFGDEVPLTLEKDNYLTKHGILIENPEDNFEDNEVNLLVPKERLEGIITVKKGGFEETEEETTEEDTEEEPEE